MTETMGGFWNQDVRGDACTSVHSTIIAPNWKQSKRPLMAEWTHKLWHIHSTEYYLAIKRNAVPRKMLKTSMNLENLLRERSQTQLAPYFRTPLT